MSIQRMAMQAGFADPVFQSQAVFRLALSALANPGCVQDVQASPPSLPECPPAAMALL
ncbi:MAG: phosphonate C-P lyase system protein PhnH, partial [Bosea sp. (in: a-proteobacteria)]